MFYERCSKFLQKSSTKTMRLFVAAFVMAAVVMGTYTLYASIVSSLAVSRATRNFGAEVSERIGTTPLQAFGMAANSLNNGSVTVDFSSHQTNRWGSSTTDFNLTILADAENEDYAFYGEFYVDGTNLDFMAYINRDRVAVGSSMLGDDLYGINLNTFTADITSLSALLGLDYYELAMVEDILDGFFELMGQAPVETDSYVAALVRTLLAAEQVVDQVTTLSDGSSVPAMRVEYTISVETLVDILDEWLDILESDEAIQLQFNNFLMQSVYGSNFIDELVQELRYGVQEIENYLDGQILLAFYIGERDRLLHVELDVDITAFDERLWLNLFFDLGTSALDTWRLDVNGFEFDRYFSFYATWEIIAEDDVYTNVLTLSFHDGLETYILTSEWDTVSGAFTFAYVDEHYHWGRNEGEFSGYFVTDGESFSLLFEHSDHWYSYVRDWSAFDALWDAFWDSFENNVDAFGYYMDLWDSFDWDAHSVRHEFVSEFSLEISTTIDTPQFEPVDFINIDQWGRMLIDMVGFW